MKLPCSQRIIHTFSCWGSRITFSDPFPRKFPKIELIRRLANDFLFSFTLPKLFLNRSENIKARKMISELYFLVGVAGFEPAAPCSQSRCANRTALHPEQYPFSNSEEPTALPRFRDALTGLPARMTPVGRALHPEL